MNNAHIIKTDPAWFYNLEKLSPTGLVVFPRSDTKNINNICKNDRIYFLSTKTPTHPHIAFLGMALFNSYTTLSLIDLWNTYKTSTGFNNLNELINSLKGIHIKDTTLIGCIFLHNIVSFKDYILLSSCNISFKKETQVRKKISLADEQVILNQISLSSLQCAEHTNPPGYDTLVNTTRRVNHEFFRADLLLLYNKCLICGISNPKILRASHSKPWKESNSSEKTDPMNGLLLCCNHDSLYDNHLISFDASGKILISSTLIQNDLIRLGLSPSIQLSIQPAALNFISFHRKRFYEKEKRNRKNP